MNFETILGSVDFLEFLRGKKATFLLSASVTKTCEIPQISQAGIPGKLYFSYFKKIYNLICIQIII